VGVDLYTYDSTNGPIYDNFAVTMNAAPVNAAPVAVVDSYSTAEDTLLNVAAPGVLGNDTDADGDLLTAVLDTGVANGELTLNSDGSFSYTPNAGFSGSDSFSYRASDGAADSNVVTVTITATVDPLPTNYPPTAEFEFVQKRRKWVKFTDLSKDSDGTIVSREWNFGDGHIMTTTVQTVKHRYRRSGKYSVTLTVTDDNKKTNSITKKLFVGRKKKMRHRY
jgi:VCBS repeat-containing protein